MGNENRRRFGGVVRQLRTERGWTLEGLAERTGLHATYVGGVERGERNIGFDNILKLARALEVPVSALFSELGGGQNEISKSGR
jgi:transcriptional regulator with XRE-family HTH domain